MLYLRLLVLADCEGRFPGTTRGVLGLALAERWENETVLEAEVAAWLDEMEAKGLMARYEAKGATYIVLLRFYRMANDRVDAKYPVPPFELGTDGNRINIPTGADPVPKWGTTRPQAGDTIRYRSGDSTETETETETDTETEPEGANAPAAQAPPPGKPKRTRVDGKLELTKALGKFPCLDPRIVETASFVRRYRVKRKQPVLDEGDWIKHLAAAELYPEAFVAAVADMDKHKWLSYHIEKHIGNSQALTAGANGHPAKGLSFRAQDEVIKAHRMSEAEEWIREGGSEQTGGEA
jgi:hypothetical protein